MARGKLLACVLGVAMVEIASAARIGDCSGGRFAPNLSTVAGLPFEGALSPDGTFLVANGTVTLGSCPTPSPFTIRRHRRRLHARWDSCGPFTRVRLRLQVGANGQCDNVVGIIRYRDASGRRVAFKFPADLAEG